MSDKLQEFVRESIDQLLKSLPPEELLKRLPPEERLKGLPPEERLKGLSADDVVKGLPPEVLEAAIASVDHGGRRRRLDGGERFENLVAMRSALGHHPGIAGFEQDLLSF
jgi:hypothetical protein